MEKTQSQVSEKSQLSPLMGMQRTHPTLELRSDQYDYASLHIATARHIKRRLGDYPRL
jgi:hypothetical protein